jgi:hypothetical protein
MAVLWQLASTIPSLVALLEQKYRILTSKLQAAGLDSTQFTCFTSTKVQMRTPELQIAGLDKGCILVLDITALVTC